MIAKYAPTAPRMRAMAGPPAVSAGTSRSWSRADAYSPSARTRAALSTKYRYSTGLVTPASAATASIGSSGPCLLSTRRAAATNSSRRCARCAVHRSRRASRRRGGVSAWVRMILDATKSNCYFKLHV